MILTVDTLNVSRRIRMTCRFICLSLPLAVCAALALLVAAERHRLTSYRQKLDIQRVMATPGEAGHAEAGHTHPTEGPTTVI